MLRALIVCVALLAPLFAAAQTAKADTLESLAPRLAAGSFNDRAAVVEQIAATGDPRAAALLEALLAGDLQALKADGRLARVSDGAAFDALSGESLGALARGAGERIRVNNAVRRAVSAALGALGLRDADPARRIAAASAVFTSRDAAQLGPLDAALAAETDARARRALEQARASVVLATDASPADKIAALDVLIARGDRDALSLATAALADRSPQVAAAAEDARAAIERAQALWDAARNVWFGLSLGSVLMLAAIGLAITFGVMGVINMAHGELVMLGAYSAYAVQQGLAAVAPGLMEWSLALALPVAFLVAGAAGVAIERGVVRWLYHRPLETLLATFGISIALQQLAKNIFGTQARPLTAPSWLSGAVSYNDVIGISNIRIAIFVLALIFLALLLYVLKRTRLGLEVRAVTQNPGMAASMGINPDRINMLTFGLGSGIAGIAGVAIGLYAQVTSEMGAGYIVQSFMTVVVGGVGNVWGTLAGAALIGFLQMGIEWFNPSNTLAAQTYMILFIIIFIQFRPKGIVALKGRAAGA